MPELKIHHPISFNRMDRLEEFKSEFPHASSIINLVSKSAEDFRYGAANSFFLNNYHFSDGENVERFFKNFYKKRIGFVSPSFIENETQLTINCLAEFNSSQKNQTELQFTSIIQEFIREIGLSNRKNEPFFRLVVGATGSGKTAFSKAIFTVGIGNFWQKNIIPSRVEYSKFVIESQQFEPDNFSRFIAQCQCRDALIWLFFGSGLPKNELNDTIAELQLPANTHTRLMRLLVESIAISFDGEKTSLQNINKVWRRCVGFLPPDVSNRIVEIVCRKYDLTYFLSFDGFDIINVEDFFIDEELSAPIDHIVSLLKGQVKGVVNSLSSDNHITCHFLVYLRDTTYERIKMVMQKGVGGRFRAPHCWIVPPTYSDLFSNSALHITSRSSLGHVDKLLIHNRAAAM